MDRSVPQDDGWFVVPFLLLCSAVQCSAGRGERNQSVRALGSSYLMVYNGPVFALLRNTLSLNRRCLGPDLFLFTVFFVILLPFEALWPRFPPSSSLLLLSQCKIPFLFLLKNHFERLEEEEENKRLTTHYCTDVPTPSRREIQLVITRVNVYCGRQENGLLLVSSS